MLALESNQNSGVPVATERGSQLQTDIGMRFTPAIWKALAQPSAPELALTKIRRMPRLLLGLCTKAVRLSLAAPHNSHGLLDNVLCLCYPVPGPHAYGRHCQTVEPSYVTKRHDVQHSNLMPSRYVRKGMSVDFHMTGPQYLSRTCQKKRLVRTELLRSRRPTELGHGELQQKLSEKTPALPCASLEPHRVPAPLELTMVC